LVVGFDLDMTLVDSAAGITATLQAAIRACPGGEDVQVGRADVWPWIGVPLEATAVALAPRADPDQVARAYRERYATIGVPLTSLLPGAVESIGAVHDVGGRVLVVSAKAEAGVHEVLTAVGLDRGELKPDLVVGGLFAAAKGDRLKREGAHVYVGDHSGDVQAAQVAGAVSVAVATGPQPVEMLVAAGADVVLTDLGRFPKWLSAFMPEFSR
jgi:phosphoglycolate phosphatase